MVDVGIIEALIAGTALVGGGVVKGFWDAWRAKGERKQLEADLSGEFKIAELQTQAGTEDRLWNRVTELEQRVDEHDRYCDEKITLAIQRSEEQCDEKITRKLRSQAAQLRAEFRRGLDEASHGD